MSTTRIMKLEDSIERGFARVEAKVDVVRNELTNHRIEMAAKVTEIDNKAEASHIRMDDHAETHKDSRKWWLALWITAIGAAIASAFRWLIKERP